MLNQPIKMKYNTDIYKVDKSNPNENVLCAEIRDISVDVYGGSIVDAFGCEFLYHFYFPENEISNISNYIDLPMSSITQQSAWMWIATSSENGWGRSNCKKFTPCS